MTKPRFKLLQYKDLGSIFDNPFTYDDPCLPDLVWRELEDGNVVGSIVELPDHHLPDGLLFSGRTVAHQNLCARVAAWLLAQDRGYQAAHQDLVYPGGVADVVSTDHRLFAECGYTGHGKLLHALHAGLELLVASYSFEPVIFRRERPLVHFESYLKAQEEGAKRAVELLPVALHYKDKNV